ncbi:hypothetical protein NUM3379_43210 [Kineococcus sp. NUM-3379]
MRRGAHRTRRGPGQVALLVLLVAGVLAGVGAAVVVLAGDVLAALLALLR